MKKNNIWVILGILGGLWLIAVIAAGVFMFVYSDSSSINNKGNVAVIPVHGVISVQSSGSFSMEGITSDQVIANLKKANNNPNVKAIILDINSPGGSGVAADEIGQAIKSIDKPVIAVIRDYGASAAYWIASATDYIFVNRLSVTGSIGVIGSYLDFSGFIEDYNISYQRYVSGELKDMGSAFKKPSTQERIVFQEIIDDMKQIFVEEVALNRNLSIKKVNGLATGQIFLGGKAKQFGLVDAIGTKLDATSYLENKYNISVELIDYKEKKGLSDFFGLSSDKIGTFINSNPSFQFK